MEFGYTTLALRSMFGTNNGIAGQAGGHPGAAELAAELGAGPVPRGVGSN